MSILIKGIDLPNGPIKLVLYPSGKVDEYVFNERIATDYQAIQIPKDHGRLIDKDELLSHLKKDPLFSLVEQYGISGVIESRPTILEEEKE